MLNPSFFFNLFVIHFLEINSLIEFFSSADVKSYSQTEIRVTKIIILKIIIKLLLIYIILLLYYY